MTELITQVADRLAIAEQIYRYCRSMDRIDHELGYSVWHEDGTADYGEVFRGTGRGFVDHVLAMHAGMQQHSHQVSNILIELDGNSAGSESYVTVTLRSEMVGKLVQINVISRYLDRWSKRDGRWAIDHRQTIIEMDEMREIQPKNAYNVARRDRTDPSYTVLKG